MSETMYGSVLEEITTLFVDTLVFLFKSIFFLLETLYLTLLPNRFRKFKVSKYCNMFRANNVTKCALPCL